MSVRASLIAALVLGSGLAMAPAPSALAAAAVGQAADPVAPEVSSVPVRAEPDGTPVRLDVSVWPQSSGKHPVVLLAHGFGGSKDSVTSQANDLHDRGYVVIAWSARGHGQSGGRIHLNDPAYEIADARTLLDLAAKRSDVELDAPGDPRAGVMGASYGGALALMLAGSDRRVDGVVSAITWNDLADAFFPQAAVTRPPTTAAGRSPIDGAGPFKQVWATNFFLSALRGGQGGQARGRRPLRPLRPDHLPALRPGLRDRHRVAAADRAAARAQPEADDERRHRADLPRPGGRRLALRPRPGRRHRVGARRHGHSVCRPVERRGSRRREHARGRGGRGVLHVARPLRPRQGQRADPPCPQRRSRTAPQPVAPGQPTTLHTLTAYPGLSGAALRTRELPLATTSGALVHPPGGQPASLIAVPGLAALGVSLSTYQIAALPGQSTALDTQPLAEAATVVGSPTMRTHRHVRRRPTSRSSRRCGASRAAR